MGISVNEIRSEFPILHQEINGKPLIYLDNAATTQKPKSVIEALQAFYTQDNSNIHRAAHTLANRATAHYEESRESVRRFIHAPESSSCIFTRGTTEAINLVAQSYGRMALQEGDEVLISGMEHHSNIVPWQLICAERKAILKVIPIHDDGSLAIEQLDTLITHRTRIVACVWVSNALGTINPIEQIIPRAHAVGARVLVDAAQACAHIDIDVQAFDIDFLVFSAHKMYGPTGVGVLYGKKHLLEAMPPYQGGGEMIREVRFENSTWNELPYKFEAGTPNIADVIAFKHAIGFIERIGKSEIRLHEQQLYERFVSGLHTLPIQRYGTCSNSVAVQSFTIQNLHPFDAGMLLDARGIAVRTGHHCTQPLMRRFEIEGTIRASFAVYNTLTEVDSTLEALERICKLST